MADVLSNRLTRPCLLDRLTHDRAASQPRGAVAPTAISQKLTSEEYRDRVLRDLQWLLGAHAMARVEEIEQFPNVARSVVNYGMPDLASILMDGITGAELEQMVRSVIERFEPRINPRTLVVEVVNGQSRDWVDGLEIKMKVEIWAIPEPVFLKTDIDVITGQVKLARR